MAGTYAIVAKIRDPSVKAALQKALAGDSRLDPQDVELITEASLDFKGVSYHEFKDLQLILQESKSMTPASREFLQNFLDKRYDSFLRYQDNLRRFDLGYVTDHIPKKHMRRPGTALTPTSLTIHGTANPKSTAKGERGWLTNPTNKRKAAFHIVVDELQAIECIPPSEVAWHAGTEKGNTESIGLEICESGDRTKTLKNAASLAAKLLRDRGLNTSNLKKHEDWSQKKCPRILINGGFREKPHQTWDWFKREVSDRL